MKKLKKIFSVLLVFLVLMGSYAENSLVFADQQYHLEYKCEVVKVVQKRPNVNGNTLSCRASKNGCIDTVYDLEITSKIVDYNGNPISGLSVTHDAFYLPTAPTGTTDANGFVTTTHPSNYGYPGINLRYGRYTVSVEEYVGTTSFNKKICDYSFVIDLDECDPRSTLCDQTDQPPFGEEEIGQKNPAQYSLCDQIPDSDIANKSACRTCVEQDSVATAELGEFVEGTEGVWTAFGCIKKSPTTIIQQIIKIGLGMAGGFTLLTFLAAGFSYSTAQNDAKKTAEARDQISAALIGLLFIIFSVTILQFIGSSVLKIPGFGG